MSAAPTHIACSTNAEWTSAWEGERSFLRVRRPDAPKIKEIAHFVGGALYASGFRLFQNGGLPLVERRVGPLREEIVFIPAPRMHLRAEEPFQIRVHLSSAAVARVRTLYWRPASRAPGAVASGDISEVSTPGCRCLWYGREGARTAEEVVGRLTREILPWFGAFHNPSDLKARLYLRTLPLVDDCTALELLLAEFDPFEGRCFLDSRQMMRREGSGPIAECHGYELDRDRIDPIAAYYRLR